MFGGGPQSGAQGYNLPRYGVDLAIRKDFTWKNGRSGNLTLSMNDIFRTQLFQSYSESSFFNQTNQRRSWGFGIKVGSGFVHHQHLGVAAEGDGDQEFLLHTAGKTNELTGQNALQIETEAFGDGVNAERVGATERGGKFD